MLGGKVLTPVILDWVQQAALTAAVAVLTAAAAVAVLPIFVLVHTV